MESNTNDPQPSRPVSNEYSFSREEYETTRNQLNEYARRVDTVFAAQKRWFRVKERLHALPDPILLLERRDGSVELYNNVKDAEFNVPGNKAGEEKKIMLGTGYQRKIPYAGDFIRLYDCHEDWAFPRMWGKINVYTGQYPDKIRQWLTDPTKIKNGIPILLEQANVNSEVMRDRERKFAMAWEKFAKSQQLGMMKQLRGIITVIGIVVVIAIFIIIFFGGNSGDQVVESVRNGTSGIIIGG